GHIMGYDASRMKEERAYEIPGPPERQNHEWTRRVVKQKVLEICGIFSACGKFSASRYGRGDEINVPEAPILVVLCRSGFSCFWWLDLQTLTASRHVINVSLCPRDTLFIVSGHVIFVSASGMGSE